MTNSKTKKQKDSVIQRLEPPSQIVFSLAETDLCVVSTGEKISAGALLASSPENSPKIRRIHSPLTGEVLLASSSEIVIRGKWPVYQSSGKHCSADELSSAEIIQKACECGLVGMGGSQFPTYLKFKNSASIDYVIVNGCESEPYLTCDHRVLNEYLDEVECGMKLAMQAVGAKKGFIATVKDSYSSGYERSLIKKTLGREVPATKLPQDVGVIVINVQTARALHRAICENRPLTERVITVDGLAVSQPGNYEVPLGTEVSHIFEQCQVDLIKVKQIIEGGPMMGKNATLHSVVSGGTCGILALTQKEIYNTQDNPCIRCGLCYEVCPLDLPAGRLTFKPTESILKCIECGICQFICPAQRSLVHQLRLAKKRFTSNETR